MNENRDYNLNGFEGCSYSRDYETLWDLSEHQSVICIVKNGDVSLQCQCRICTCKENVVIESEGIYLVNSKSKNYFVSQCKKHDVRFIDPNCNDQFYKKGYKHELNKSGDIIKDIPEGLISAAKQVLEIWNSRTSGTIGPGSVPWRTALNNLSLALKGDDNGKV